VTAAWQTVTSGHAATLRSFLMEQEPICTAISERFRRDPGYRVGQHQETAEQSVHPQPFRRQRRNINVHRWGRFFLYQNTQGQMAAVYQGPGGYFFPLNLVALQPQLPGLYNVINWEPPIRTIIGATSDVISMEEFLQSHLPQNLIRVVDYSLLSRPVLPGQYDQDPRSPDPKLEILRPHPSSWRSLMPIQIAYEKEEVLAPGRKPIIAHSRDHLIDSLNNQIVLIAVWKETIIGRVATNALGYHYGQVGGVYTIPGWRRRGVARWLMLHLLYELQRRQRGASLFVKHTNIGARRLYKSLGFHDSRPFRISYFSEST